MPKSRRARIIALADLLARRRPELDIGVIADGRVLVDGRVLDNPRARVRSDASLRIVPVRRLRGDIKLSHAIDVLGISIAHRVALDVGASAGGFTSALLDRGVSRVYAVDAGFGQLRGWLRNDTRVVNLEGRNIAVLDAELVPDVIDVVTVDLSYLALDTALPQLERLRFARGADLLALVKPTFELRAGTMAASDRDVAAAVERVESAIERTDWAAVGRCAAPAPGRRGAREVFLHARRR